MEWCLRVIHFRRRKQLFEMDKNICKSQGGLSPRGIISSRKTTLSFLQDAPMLSSGEVAKQTKSRRNLVIHYFSKDASLSIWIKYKMSRKFHRECIKNSKLFPFAGNIAQSYGSIVLSQSRKRFVLSNLQIFLKPIFHSKLFNALFH